LAVFSVVAGFVGNVTITEWLGLPNYAHFLNPAWAHEAEFNFTIAGISFVVAGLGILTAYALYAKRPLAWTSEAHDPLRAKLGKLYIHLENKWYADEVWSWIVNQILFRMAAGCAWFDRHIVDGTVNLVGFLTRGTGTLMQPVQTGRLQNYILAVFIGLIVILGFLYLEVPEILAQVLQ
jgi:NADH-quinone oxidoreductase subunit L